MGIYSQPHLNVSEIRAHGPLAGIVLAGGMSARMGSFKPVLPLGGVPTVVHVVRGLACAEEIHPLIVVTGNEAEKVREALRGFAVTFVHNPDYEAGEMVSSLKAGLKALPANVGGAMVSFADQPGVAPDTVRHLVRAWQGANAPVVMPMHMGKRGHPVVISADVFPEIMWLGKEDTLKTVVARHMSEALQVAVEDPRVLDDMDTMADYERVRDEWPRGAMTV